MKHRTERGVVLDEKNGRPAQRAICSIAITMQGGTNENHSSALMLLPH
jgi:hypothetical protein